MGREIKFRGKRVDNGEWVYGYYAECDEPYDNGGVEHLYREGTWVHHVIVDRNGHADEVIPDSVGQYVDKEDINGTDMYTGDEVWCTYELNGNIVDRICHRGVVEFDRNGFGVRIGCRFRLLNNFGFGWCYEVVGNIHDKEDNHGRLLREWQTQDPKGA